MVTVYKNAKNSRAQHYDSANTLRMRRPDKWTRTVCLTFFAVNTILFRFASAEDKKTIVETLSVEEKATLNELDAANRAYAISCLSSGKIHSRTGGRYGWDNLREGEHFVVLQNPKDRLEDAGCIHVEQIIDEQNFLGAGGTVWVEGISTKGIADDDLLKVHGARFTCVGNKTYSTVVGGSRTVMHIVRVNPDNVVKTLRPIAESRGLRVWGEGTGNLVLAEFVAATSRELTIKSWNGTRKKVSMKEVAAVDIEWIKNQPKK